MIKEIEGKLKEVEKLGDSRVQGHLTGAKGFLETALEKHEAEEAAKKVLKDEKEAREKVISDRHAAILKKEKEAGKN